MPSLGMRGAIHLAMHAWRPLFNASVYSRVLHHSRSGPKPRPLRRLARISAWRPPSASSADLSPA